jgi:hypothetical protein
LEFFYVNRVEKPTIAAVGDETWRGTVRIFFLLRLVVINGAESPECAGNFLVKWLCTSSQLRSKGALRHIVRY